MITDRDLGFKRIYQEALKLEDTVVKVGILASAKFVKVPGQKDSPSIATTAAWNEFGITPANAPRIPARPAHRIAFDSNLTQINKRIVNLYNKVLEQKATATTAAETLGKYHVGNIKRSITDLKFPPNAPYTIARKKSSNPLIDTEQTRGAVTFELVTRAEANL